MSERFHELDSLRGLAALTVISQHFLLAQPNTGGWFWRAPFNCGHEAVVFFFVLSGFVLNLPFLKPITSSRPAKEMLLAYVVFLTRRLCRIYLPYLPALLLSATLLAWLGWHALAGVGPGFNDIWTPGHTSSLLAQLNLFTRMSGFNYDPAVWSLVIELRIALIFPLLAWAINRLPWAVGVGGVLALDLASWGAERWLFVDLGWPNNDYFLTAHFLPAFVVGMALARYRAALPSLYTAMQTPQRLALWGLGFALLYKHAALLLYGCRWFYATPPQPYFLVWRADDWLATAGVALLMGGVLGSTRARTWLSVRPLVWLGGISYSLYLYHFVALVAVIRLGFGHLPIEQLTLLALPVTFALAWLSWRWVEGPTIRVVRYLGKLGARADERLLRRAA